MGLIRSAARAVAKKVIVTAAVIVGKHLVDKLAAKAAGRKVGQARSGTSGK